MADKQTEFLQYILDLMKTNIKVMELSYKAVEQKIAEFTQKE